MSFGIEDLAKRGSDGSLLIIRYYALGDIVLSFPLVRALRSRLPEARIDYLCLRRFTGAFEGLAEIDGVLAMDGSLAGRARTVASMRKRRYDMVIDLLSSPGSAIMTFLSGAGCRVGMDTGRNNWCYHRVLPRSVVRDDGERKLYTMDSNIETGRQLGLDLPDPVARSDASSREERYRTGLPASERHSDWARETVSRWGEGRAGLAGIVPGAKYQAKSWPESHFIRLCRLLRERLGLTPVILWGPGEEEIAASIAASDEKVIMPPAMGIGELAALIGELSVVVGIDSGPKHLAVVQGVPTVTIFGPTDPRVWDPMTPLHVALYRDLDCRPCSVRECSEKRCMDRITPDEVLSSVEKVVMEAKRRGKDQAGGTVAGGSGQGGRFDR